MNTVNIRLYDFIRKEFNLTDEKAKAFAEVISEVIGEDIKQEQPMFKSWFKDDFYRIENQMSEMRRDINRLDVKISESKTDIVRWLLAFWFGQIAVIAGLLMYFLKK